MINPATTKYALLREAYAIIDGVPWSALNLVCWAPYGVKADPYSCGTIGCAAGILAVHPDMNGAGLVASVRGAPVFRHLIGYEALAVFFGTGPYDTYGLFSPRSASYFDTPCALDRFPTDKGLWLYRVRQFLRNKGEHVAIEEPAT